MSLICLLLACTCGEPEQSAQSPGAPSDDQSDEVLEQDHGKWFKATELSPAEQERVAELEALGYADGTMEANASGVTVGLDNAQGYNFYASGHGPEAVLTDMEGKELHRWHHEFWDAFPTYPVKKTNGSTHNFRRARLIEGGHILSIHEGLAMIRIDAQSRLVWAFDGRAHHDAQVVGDQVYALSRTIHRRSDFRPKKTTVEDFISILDLATGEELRRVSLLDAFMASDTPHRDLLDRVPDKADVFHTNTIEVLDGALAKHDPSFAAGNVLVSMRNISAIAVVDLIAQKVVWSHTGQYRLQHDPTATDGGLMLFDNSGLRGKSRVLWYDLPSMDLRWQWAGPESLPMHSRTLGTVALLPNGHVLVTESERGRAMQVNVGTGDVVWEFYNPHRAGPNGQFIAALFEVERLPADADISWAKGGPTEPQQARFGRGPPVP